MSQASSAVGGNVNASTVRNTPLNGRDWAQLATLQAGVTGVQNGSATGGGNTDRGFGAAVSISGARPDQNSYRLDGISINDYSNGAPGSVLGDNLGIDAVEQVSVSGEQLSSRIRANFGRRDQRGDALGEESVSTVTCTSFCATARSMREITLTADDSAVQAQSVRRLGGGADPERSHVHFWGL